MPLITHHMPDTWHELEETVRDILEECGMDAKRGVHLDFPRGGANIDVMAIEVTDGIAITTLCECKFWSSKVTQDVVHAFRTVMPRGRGSPRLHHLEGRVSIRRHPCRARHEYRTRDLRRVPKPILRQMD
ncbi:restriction endonuclease [Mesorhizobium sp. M0589]|uniref:restriction endonuclease n=1 Tax=Mesorhizobium sp. M0589 TaxID=2956965 RepID=UPI0033359C3C